MSLLGLGNIWPRYNYLKIWNLRVQKNLNIEKIAFKVVQIKFLAIHITKLLILLNIIFSETLNIYLTIQYNTNVLHKTLVRKKEVKQYFLNSH